MSYNHKTSTYRVVYIVSTLNDFNRTLEGLYHYPKLENAGKIRKTPSQVFNQDVAYAIDPDNDHVAYLVSVDHSYASPQKLEGDVVETCKTIADLVKSAKSLTQELEVRVKDVYGMGLRDMGVQTPPCLRVR
jgi:hypothetical protein